MTEASGYPTNSSYTPDFFIAGAMKSGTSSVYALLRHHPDICMSIPKETALLTRDDVFQRPFYFWQYYEEWKAYDWPSIRQYIDREYKPYFTHAKEGQILGEATTTYISSPKAPSRIREVNPSAKIIFLLRDPVVRAYSQYWHAVSKGYTVYPFEKHLMFETSSTLQRSLYKEQIQRYFEIFDRTQIKIFIFEDFAQNTQKCLDDICDFLGVKPIEAVRDESRQNVAQTPRFIGYQLWLNRLHRLAGSDFSSRSIPKKNRLRQNTLHRLLERLHRANMTDRKYPPMKSGTRAMMEAYFARENRGLSDLIGIDVTKYWPYFQENT